MENDHIRRNFKMKCRVDMRFSERGQQQGWTTPKINQGGPSTHIKMKRSLTNLGDSKRLSAAQS